MKPWSWFLPNADGTFSADPEKVDVFDCPRCREKQVRAKGSVDLVDPPMCEDCQELERLAAQRERAERQRGERVIAAGVPALYREGFVEPAAWPALPDGTSARAWRGRPWCLTFHGRSGSGKSFLATALFSWLAASDRPFATIGEGDDRPVRGTWISAALAAEQLFGARSADRFEQLARCEVLLIDDFGREVTATAREKLSTVLGVRFADQLPTLITTNLEPTGTAERPGIARLDPALGRRLDSGLLIEMNQKWSLP